MCAKKTGITRARRAKFVFSSCNTWNMMADSNYNELPSLKKPKAHDGQQGSRRKYRGSPCTNSSSMQEYKKGNK